MNNLKNMLVLKDLPSNLIEEAYIVLNPNLKLKIKEMDNKEVKDSKGNKEKYLTEKDKVLEKNYILEEAKYVLLNYISQFETQTDKINNKLLEKKYKKLKKITIFTLVGFLLYVVITTIF